jgi:hypothetical protein
VKGAPAAFDATLPAPTSIPDGNAGGVTGSGPHRYADGKLQGVSVEINYKV